MDVLAMAAALPVAATQMGKGSGTPITDSNNILGKRRREVEEDDDDFDDEWNGWL